MEILSINKNRLQAVLLFAAKQDVRYILKSVNLASADGIYRLNASCGHTMATCIQANPLSFQFNVTIPREKIELALKAAPKTKLGIDVDLVNHTIEGIPFDPVEGNFPDVRRAWPEKMDGLPCKTQSQYIERIEKAAKLLGQGNMGHSFWFDSRRKIGRAHV